MVTEKMIEAAARADAAHAGRTFDALSGADKKRFLERAQLMLEAAAPANYESRILSALSAQVQDVAGYEYRLVTKEGREYARLKATTDEEAQTINDNNFAGRLKVERRVVPEWEVVAAPAKQESGE